MVRRTPSQLFLSKVSEVTSTDIEKIDAESMEEAIKNLKEFIADVEDKISKAEYYKELKQLKEKYGIVD